MQDTTKFVSLDVIDDPRIAMRGDIHGEDIEQLMSDMRAIGLIEPIVIRKNGERYEVIAGHRRTTAARLLGWPTIECKIVDVNDDDAFTMRTIENLSRHDVNPVDEAGYVKELMLRSHKSVDEIAKIFNRTANWVETRLTIAEFPPYLVDYVGQKRISLGAAIYIAKLEPESKRQYYANWAALNGVSVSGAKRWYDMMLAEGGLQNVSDDQIGDVANAAGKFVPHTICKACGEDKPLDDLDNIWVCRGLSCQDSPTTPSPTTAEPA